LNTELPVNKRPLHAFLSHAHVDKTRIVDQLDHWLNDICGIPIWYDDRSLPPGAQIAKELANAIDNCRSMIIILSKTSVESGWVEQEYEAAIGQRTSTKGRFRIIAIRIEECEIPRFLKTTKWININNNSNIDIFIANKLLDGLYYSDTSINLQTTRDLYVSRTWRREESDLADIYCQLLIKAGFRLIGDAEDQRGFDENRIQSIMSSCGGFVAILPDRGQGRTSGYILKEIAISRKLALPSLIVASPNIQLPEDLTKSAIRLENTASKDNIEVAVQANIGELVDEWRLPVHPHYVFFATDLSNNDKRNQVIVEHVQRITAMPCIVGDRLREGQVQELITKKISDAFVMIADMSEDNVNTLIEAGIARGTGTRLHLVARGPRRRPPFMLRDQQVEYYSDDAELLGKVHRIIYPYRRRVLNYELPI
jgi:TIR domain